MVLVHKLIMYIIGVKKPTLSMQESNQLPSDKENKPTCRITELLTKLGLYLIPTKGLKVRCIYWANRFKIYCDFIEQLA